MNPLNSASAPLETMSQQTPEEWLAGMRESASPLLRQIIDQTLETDGLEKMWAQKDLLESQAAYIESL